MGRKEKTEEREVKKREEGLLLTERKLRRSVVLAGKRGGNCTTPPPKWRLKDNNNNEESTNDELFTEFLSRDTSPMVSARKLCANLWDIECHKNPDAQMAKGGQRTRRRPQRSNGFRGDSKNNDQEEAASASSFRRAASASLIEYRRSIERNDGDRAIQPVSPVGYASTSMEVAPYKHSLAPASLKFRMVGPPSYSRKTSAELIKVLNRIWSLEEQNASNASVVRALRTELDRSRARVKELMIEKETDRQEMDELVKRVTDKKLFRKSVEQDRIRAAVQSARDDLEDERKLRKRSEALHRKLGREISELKSPFANALRELERERKARILLESLCDEFAKGISDYEHEVRAMKLRAEKERCSADQPDRLILHISEAWLDERMQMKLAEEETNVAEKATIVEKLGFDIAMFLRAKRSTIEPKSRRYSLESFPLNEVMSAPRNPAEEEDSIDNDLGSLEAKERDHPERESALANSNPTAQKVIRSASSKGNKSERESLEATEDLGALLTRKVHSEGCVGEESCCGKSLLGNASSPVQPRNAKLMSPDFEKSESSSRWPRDLDENTLMAQLIEARLERRRRSCRNKPPKGSFQAKA